MSEQDEIVVVESDFGLAIWWEDKYHACKGAAIYMNFRVNYNLRYWHILYLPLF